MDQIWKTAQINKLHHRELLQQAEQERLARLALQKVVSINRFSELTQRVVILYLNLRSANVNAASRAYKRHEIAIENK